MTLIRSGACWAVITVALYFSGCGDGEGGEGNSGGTGGSATGGSATATGGSSTGGSRAGAAATGGSAASQSAGAGGQLEANAGESNAGAGGAEDTAPSTGGTGGTITVGGSGGGDCVPLAPAEGSVLEGDARIASPADVAALREYSGITGSLEVASAVELLDVELPQLRYVGGDLRAESTGLRRFAAPRLETIDGEVWFYLNYDLVGIDLHNLTRVGTRVFIHRNIELRVLQLDALVSAAEMNSVEISGNLALPDCYLDVVGERFSFVRTSSPECSCTRSCGLVEAFCP
jgi:hypothetical protein